MKTISAISTEYGGFKFRSRTEARWAIFFDALSIPWEYEKEGYEIAGVRYLPDFWLPTIQVFAEVKPGAFDRAARNLAIQINNQTGFEVLLLSGQPYNAPVKAISNIGGRLYECEYCLTNFENYPTEEHRFYSNPSDTERRWNDTEEACRIANSARFEFGETPKRKDIINSAVFEEVYPI